MSTAPTLSPCGLDEMTFGVTDIDPNLALLGAKCVGRYARDLDEQRELTRMLGLDATPVPLTAVREPGAQVRPDGFRRGRKRRK